VRKSSRWGEEQVGGSRWEGADGGRSRWDKGAGGTDERMGRMSGWDG
jgi:hypothetical protein